MNVLIKHKLKRLIPPILLQWLNGQGRSTDSWGKLSVQSEGVGLPGGRTFHLRPTHADRDVFRQVFLDREYSIEGLARATKLNSLYRAAVRPLIIDAGANIGASAVWLALTYPNATVLAVEPERRNFECLVRNTKEFPSVVPIHAAISSRRGSLFLSDPGQGDWGFRTSSDAVDGSYEVPALTLDDLLDREPDASPFMFKIDIEGAEADLFESPSCKLATFPLIAIELHDWMLPGKANSRHFLRWHVDSNRDLLFKGENAFSITIDT